MSPSALAVDSASETVVALAGIDVAPPIDDPGPLAEKVAAAVDAGLRRNGLDALDPEVFDVLWQERLRAAGGYYDVVSGRPDPEKRRALLAATLQDLRDRHGVRVLLRPALVVLDVEYVRGLAEWDGVRETAAPTGSGNVPALSLDLRVENAEGHEIGSGRGGIQLVAKQSLWTGKYGPVPREKLLDDDKRLREAVDRALAPLLDALRAPPEPEPVTQDPVAGGEAAETPAVTIETPPEGRRVAALRPFVHPGEEITVPVEVETRFVELLRALLEDAGWWILPATAYEQAFRETVIGAGGIYDPVSGEEIGGRRGSCAAETRRQLEGAYGASAFVTAGIFVRTAQIRGEKATWDGITEQVTNIATWKKLLTTTRGRTRALSFGVLVEDRDGRPQHLGFGGIQLADRVERNRFVHVPPERLFADPARDRAAVERALGAWAGPKP